MPTGSLDLNSGSSFTLGFIILAPLYPGFKQRERIRVFHTLSFGSRVFPSRASFSGLAERVVTGSSALGSHGVLQLSSLDTFADSLTRPVKLSPTHLSLPSVVSSTVDASLKEHSHFLFCITFCTSHSHTIDTPVFLPPPPPKRLGCVGPSTAPGTRTSLTPQLLLPFLDYL